MNDKLKEYNYNSIKLLRSSRLGILSTISKSCNDYPFGSFVTFISGRSRNIYLYLSTIAEHTKNIHHTSRSCLTIFKNKKNGDIQDSERLSLIGDLLLASDKEIEFCKERFFSFYPESKTYSNFHSFNFFKLEIVKVRWIGGFGRIAWLEGEKWKSYNPDWIKDEKYIIDHMNEDHSNTIISSLNAQHKVYDKNVKMFALTIDGYYVNSKEGVFFIQFPESCDNAKEYREILVSLAKKYKSFE